MKISKESFLMDYFSFISCSNSFSLHRYVQVSAKNAVLLKIVSSVSCYVPSQKPGRKATIECYRSAIVWNQSAENRKQIIPDMLEWWPEQPGDHRSLWHQVYPASPHRLQVQLPRQQTGCQDGWQAETRKQSPVERRHVHCERRCPMTVNKHKIITALNTAWQSVNLQQHVIPYCWHNTHSH